MLKHFLIRTVGFCCRRARLIVPAAAACAIVLAWYTVENLSMDTDTDRLFPNDLSWRQKEMDFQRAFPQNTALLAIVIEAATPARADRAADALMQRLAGPAAPFKSIRRPDGGDFFRRNGLLYLPLEELEDFAEQVAEVQPFLGTLSTDPSLGGLFTMLAQAVEAAQEGEISVQRVSEPLAAVAASMESVLAGHVRPLSWRLLVTGRDPEVDELRRVILVQPALDYGALSPGAAASTFIRNAARELGLMPDHGVRVRLTGSVALSDEEFATVAEGTQLAAVVSLTLVSVLLFLAVRTAKLVFCILATLIAGIIATCAFAAVFVGSLNLISIAFIVLFIGIAVDFGIQFSVRYLDHQGHVRGVRDALELTAGTAGPSLSLAATACAVGFLALVPTDYRGMAEMGIISGAGMLIALVLNLTLLPALLVLIRPGGKPAPAGLAWAAGIDRFMARQRRLVLFAALVVAGAGLATASRLQFDFDPLHLKNPDSESVSTLYDLMGSPSATPFTADVLVPSMVAAERLSRRLEALPEVEKVLTLQSFIPKDQAEKMEIIDELSLLTGPLAIEPSAAAPAETGQTLALLKQTRDRLQAIAPASPLGEIVGRLTRSLDSVIDAYPARTFDLHEALLADLPSELNNLDLALQAAPVGFDTLPDVIRNDWIASDGRLRLEVFPRGDILDLAVRDGFANAVVAVAPDAIGPVISSLESGRTVVTAFVHAGLIALAVITALLVLVLRRVRDVLLVLAPLLLAGLATITICVAAALPLNFANIIALPLILGIGVSFSIYFVINWRNGLRMPLKSPTARAVLFSALTTGVAFGSLMLSTHPGTASMGALLSIAVGCTLLFILFVLPALMGEPDLARSA